MRIDFKPAKKFNELNDWQLSVIGKVLCDDKAIEKATYQFLLVAVLFIEKITFKNCFKFFLLLLRVPFSQLKPYTDFIFDEKDYLTNFFPKIKVGRKTLFGPGARLANITIQELAYADAFYYNWITKSDPKDLQRLVACLYRPAGTTSTENDNRKAFDKLQLPKNAELTDKIPVHKQYIIALGFQGTRRLFISRYKNIFPPEPELEEDEKPKPKKAQPYQSFTKLIQSLAMDEVQVFGNLQTTEKTNAVQFLEIYDELILRQNNS